MNHVERFRALMEGKPVDRLPMIEWAVWWNETLDRWRGEGLKTFDNTNLFAGRSIQANYCPDRYSLYEHFGLDMYYQYWFESRATNCPHPAAHGAPVISDEDDYERIKPFLYPRIDQAVEDMRPWAERQRNGECLLWITVDGFFWFPRTLFGIQDHMMAFYDEPELMQRMNQDNADYIEYVFKTLAEADCLPVFGIIAEDMSYNNGPMLSEAHFDEFMAPYYRQVVPLMEELNVIPMIDSDGNITKMVPWLEKVGVRGALPLEFQAGVDANAIREAHPEFIMIGNYNKLLMHKGEDAMRGEFERLLPVMRSGRFIPSCDHQTPPAVSLEQYHIFLKLLEEYCQKACE